MRYLLLTALLLTGCAGSLKSQQLSAHTEKTINSMADYFVEKTKSVMSIQQTKLISLDDDNVAISIWKTEAMGQVKMMYFVYIYDQQWRLAYVYSRDIK